MTDNNDPQERSMDRPSNLPVQAEQPLSIVSEVVKKIKNEPFLFVIAIAALLIGLVVAATGLGSPNLRLVVFIIASLAFIVIVGNYALQALQLYPRIRTTVPLQTDQKHAAKEPRSPQITGRVKVQDLSGAAELRGVKATKEALLGAADITGVVEIGKASDHAKATGVDLGGEPN